MALIFSKINRPTFIDPLLSTMRVITLLTMNSEVFDDAYRVFTINDAHALGISHMYVVRSICLASCLPYHFALGLHSLSLSSHNPSSNMLLMLALGCCTPHSTEGRKSSNALISLEL